MYLATERKKNMDPKNKKKFAEGPLQTLGKDGSCRWQAGGPSAKPDLRQSFAEGLTTGTRQSLTPIAPLLWAHTAERPFFAEGPALGKDGP